MTNESAKSLLLFLVTFILTPFGHHLESGKEDHSHLAAPEKCEVRLMLQFSLLSTEGLRTGRFLLSMPFRARGRDDGESGTPAFSIGSDITGFMTSGDPGAF